MAKDFVLLVSCSELSAEFYSFTALINHSGTLKSLKNVSLGLKPFLVLVPFMLRHSRTGMASPKLHGFLIRTFMQPINH